MRTAGKQSSCFNQKTPMHRSFMPTYASTQSESTIVLSLLSNLLPITILSVIIILVSLIIL